MKRITLLLCTVITVVLVSLSTVAHAENWVQFSKTHSPGFRIYYDTDSIRVNEKGDTLTFRIKSLNPQLGGLIQICDMQLSEEHMDVRVYNATMLNKKVYNPSGGLVKEEGREYLGLILKSDWDFLEDVAIYAGKHGLYPENKILNLNQYEEVVVEYNAGKNKYAYFPKTIKTTSRGIEFDFWMQDTKEYPYSSVFHCILKNDGELFADSLRVYMMWYFAKEGKTSGSICNLAQAVNPNFKKMYNDITNYARQHSGK